MLLDLLRLDEPILTEGSVYELLRRDPRIRFDPHIAHAGLIYDDRSREVLAKVHATYLAIARERSLPLLAFADTWRASAARVAASAFHGRRVNADNVAFLRQVLADAATPAFAGAYLGPRGDAYRPAEAPSSAEAMRYHAPQIEELSKAGAALIVAATLPAFEEARGIARLLAQTAVPWMLSFVVRPSGTLLDGTPLQEAIETIDAEVPVAPPGYSINCVHPHVAKQALSCLSPAVRARVLLFQGNTSTRAPEELDGLVEVESTAPEAFTDSMLTLMDATSIRAVGGCCGTDETHMRALASALVARSSAC